MITLKLSTHCCHVLGSGAYRFLLSGVDDVSTYMYGLRVFQYIKNMVLE